MLCYVETHKYSNLVVSLALGRMCLNLGVSEVISNIKNGLIATVWE